MSKNCSICKKRKTAVIESWMGMDKILFDKPLDRVFNESDKKEYIDLKNTLMLNLFELYHNINYVNSNSYEDLEALKEYASMKAELAESFAKNKIQQSDVKQMLKEEAISKENPESFIKQNYYKIALEAYLFNGVNRDLLTSFGKTEKGNLILTAHDKLIENILELVVK